MTDITFYNYRADHQEIPFTPCCVTWKTAWCEWNWTHLEQRDVFYFVQDDHFETQILSFQELDPVKVSEWHEIWKKKEHWKCSGQTFIIVWEWRNICRNYLFLGRTTMFLNSSSCIHQQGSRKVQFISKNWWKEIYLEFHLLFYHDYLKCHS